MILYYQRNSQRQITPCMEFGVAQLEAALHARGIFTSREMLRFYSPASKAESVTVSLRRDGLLAELVEKDRNKRNGRGDQNSRNYPYDRKEGFVIRRVGACVHVIGDDDAGAMYGLLDLAETVSLDGIGAICDKEEAPFMEKRGVKFNLPYHTYGAGEIFDKNKELCMTVDFWREYIDFLAKNRYNCLSLWSMNPFDMMFRVQKYPETTEYSDEELQKFKETYAFIFKHAAERGIETWLITWNLRITPAIARGLGLPPEIAERSHNRKDIKIRQSLDVVKDYYIEAIKTLLMTYPELTGLGTTNSEELTGTVEARQQWVADTYLEAIAALDFPIPFIHRTNTSNGTVTQDIFLSKYNHPEKYISWKYSNAHMYSHTLPQFETLFDAWGKMDMDDVKVLYTVRNDDFHNLRGCDPAFVAEYIRGMRRGKKYVRGFYWGADGYVWAGEFQHVDNKHRNWTYSYEKHWMQFEMLGRLGYNPELDPLIWEKKFTARYGPHTGVPALNGLSAGVRLLCAVNRLFWRHYDFDWHPESVLSGLGFKTILEFMENDAMPLVGVVSMKDYVAGKLAGNIPAGETPEDILGIIRRELDAIKDSADNIESYIKTGDRAGDIECVQLDIRAWHALGSYYLCKFTAALLLIEYRLTGGETLKKEAVGALNRGLEHWKDLAYIGSLHYLPYRMGRVGQIFGWSYYIDDVERDIRLAENI